jgi:serine phosphatase RsbU (regulator of sigma subunit)
LVTHRNGSTESIASTTPPLGVIQSPKFTETAIKLEHGDGFLLYTDGLFGWTKHKQPRLSPQQLEKLLDHSAPTAETLLKGILAHTAPATAASTSPDDMTLMAGRRADTK